MKKLILLILVCISMSLNIKAQTTPIYEEQNEKIKSLQIDISHIQQDLKNFNQQYRVGTQFLIAGVSFSAIGLGMSFVPIYNSPEALFKIGFPIIGGLLCLTGTIIHIDAHKYLGGKASLSVGQDGVSLGVNF